MNIPEDLCWGDMSEDQRDIVRMWWALGLPFECGTAFMDGRFVWHDGEEVAENSRRSHQINNWTWAAADPDRISPKWCFRLKP